MRKILMAAYFTLSVSYCFAQQKQTDSLLNELSKHPAEDTIKLNLLLRISNFYSDFDPEKGLEISDQAILLSKKLNNEQKIGSAYAFKAFNYGASGNDSLALNMFIIALKYFEHINNQKAIGTMYHNIGNKYFSLSQYEKALEYHGKAEKINEDLHDTVSLASTYNSMGNDYQYLSNYTKAVEFYLKSLHIYESGNRKNDIADALGNLGIFYSKIGEISKALEYGFKALKIHQESGNQRGIANIFSGIANSYYDIDSTQKALEYHDKALKIYESIGYKRGAANENCNIGIIYNELAHYSEGLQYLEKAVEVYNEVGDMNSLSIALNNIGNVYCYAPDSFLIKQGISLLKRFEKALEFQKRSLKLAQEIGSVDQQVSTYQSLMKTYEAQKDFPKAFESAKNYIHLHDSILNDEKKSEITKKEMQYEFDKKEVLIKADHDKKEALANAEIKRQLIIKNSAMGGASVLLLAAGIIFVLYKRRRDAEEQKKESDFKAEVSETEMKALRSQMNPHFIFNSLNSIGDYISRNDNKAADNYLSKFAKVMRMILENSEQKEVSLEDDLKALELYMQLESLRMNNKFTYQIKVDETIDIENTLIPPLLLQPFVENSIWHGISKKQGIGKILIEIKKEGEMINCIIEDDGIGREKSFQQKTENVSAEKKSLGMKITKSRIDIINKIKKSKAGVELSDLAEGMRVEVRLPFESTF